MTRLEQRETPQSVAADAREVQARGAWGSWKAVVLLVLAVTAARIVYLRFFCPYTLVEDEAFYWEWSRRLALSYYTKGPGIAWTIAGFTGLFGDTAFAVRLPAVLFGGLTALVLARLGEDVTEDEGITGGEGRPARVAFLAAAGFLVIPMYQVMGLLMTIDGPYAACWAMACWAAWRAFRRGSRAAWLGLGAAIGVGFLYKYTILLLLPGLVLFAILRRRELRVCRHATGWGIAGLLVMFAAFVPVVVWNQQQGWPTLAHLLGHLGVKGGDVPVTQGQGQGWHYSPKWTLDFVGAQIGMVGPMLAVMALACRRSSPTSPRAGADVFLMCCGLPLLVTYLLVSFVTEPEGNWALASYLTGVLLAARVIAGSPTPTTTSREGALLRWSWKAAVWVGVIVALALLRFDLMHRVVQPVYEKIVGEPRRPLIPLGRFMGADVMSAHAQRLVDQLHEETGLDPFVISLHYGRAAQFAFYMPGHPSITCSTSLMNGRRTNYDYWEDTDLRDTRRWGGRPALLSSGDSIEVWQPYFDEVKLVGRLDGDMKVNRDGSPSRPVYFGYGFRGFPDQYKTPKAIARPRDGEQ